MSTAKERKPVRLGDVLPRHPQSRHIGRVLHWAAGHGIAPEEAELLRRQIEREYDEEDVSEWVDDDGNLITPNPLCRRRLWLSREWLKQLEQLIEERRGGDGE